MNGIQQQDIPGFFVTSNLSEAIFLSAGDHFSKTTFSKSLLIWMVVFCLGVGGSFLRALVLLTLLSLKISAPSRTENRTDWIIIRGNVKITFYVLYITLW